MPDFSPLLGRSIGPTGSSGQLPPGGSEAEQLDLLRLLNEAIQAERLAAAEQEGQYKSTPAGLMRLLGLWGPLFAANRRQQEAAAVEQARRAAFQASGARREQILEGGELPDLRVTPSYVRREYPMRRLQADALRAQDQYFRPGTGGLLR